MVTLRTIAEKCGLDVSTISKVIHGRDIRVTDETRKRILDTARELDYRPNVLARSLRLRKSGAVAMVVRHIDNSVYPELIEGAQEAAERRGVCLFLVKASAEERTGASLIALVQEGRVDGILWDDLPYPAFAQELSDAHVPFVCLNAHGDVAGQCVTLNDEAGFQLQAEYLADLGHRRIGFVGICPESDVSELCRSAFMRALAARSIEVDPAHLYRCQFGGADVASVAERLVRGDRPSAVAVASIIAAKRLCNLLTTSGVRIPEDLSLIGYHDMPDAEWNAPPITTVQMPSREQGAVALECLMDLIGGGIFYPREIQGRPQIVQRGSCAPPK